MDKNLCTFGVAGNFTGHLEQAGEAVDFKNIVTKEVNAPKAIFPTFINSLSSSAPDYLKSWPFDSEKILFPKDQSNLQIEPECGIIFNLTWENDCISKMEALEFGASNDCSIRKAGAKKISEKKNWGPSSKGFSQTTIKFTDFTASGIINSYRIASFIKRDNQVYEYGENSAVKDYSFIYGKLVSWMIEKFNTQKDEGPAENLHEYLLTAGKPEKIMVSIGATRYTQFGENNYLKNGDKTYVIVYPETISSERILDMVKNDSPELFQDKTISALVQTVIL